SRAPPVPAGSREPDRLRANRSCRGAARSARHGGFTRAFGPSARRGSPNVVLTGLRPGYLDSVPFESNLAVHMLSAGEEGPDSRCALDPALRATEDSLGPSARRLAGARRTWFSLDSVQGTWTPSSSNRTVGITIRRA